MTTRLPPWKQAVGAQFALGRQRSVRVPTTDLTNEFRPAACGTGSEKLDFAVIFDVLAGMAGVQK
jgi:hypothetical protein